LVILIFVLVATTPLIGMMAMPYAFLGPDETLRRQADVPDELVGVDAPFTTHVRDALDQALGIEVTNPLGPLSGRLSGPRSGPSRDEPILELVDLHAGYGPIEVLRGVNLQVPPGAVVALLGPNGGGKTTTLRVCSGLLPATSGQLRVAGRTVNQASASQLARVGVCTIPEGRSIFPNLTVRENLWLATGSGTAFPAVEETAYTRFPVLGQRRQQLAGTLSGGEQQMLALARALGTAPTVLLLDELSLGLAPLIVSQVYDTVRELAAAGISILIAEQFARAVLPIAHSAAIMLHGCIVHVGSPDTIEEQLSTTYLGVNNVA
jgi:branched-chain amino acid transport system ATP-binding protein